MADTARSLGDGGFLAAPPIDRHASLNVRLSKFVIGALCLVLTATATWIFFGWMRSEQQWIDDRQAAVDWAESSAACNLWRSSNQRRLPTGLRVLGEQNCIEYFWIDPEKLPANEAFRIRELRGLFPEARVIAMSHRLPTPLILEDETYRRPGRRKVTYGLVLRN